MASTDTRRIAADARRVSDKPEGDRVEEIRKALTDNYERGRQSGREEMAEELAATDARRLLLDVASGHITSIGDRLAGIPNSKPETRACAEAAAILRDAAGAAPTPLPTRRKKGR